ncbi:hypothetical protein [Aminiphilus circumscriptus]|uniref:hypothetical protein n=1 Tax=Aminiphilus circumscriptus TaxID=290732 RepID=UPI0004709DC6|nr:hypothetical protein [Aminiphilus circumscriptus]
MWKAFARGDSVRSVPGRCTAGERATGVRAPGLREVGPEVSGGRGACGRGVAVRLGGLAAALFLFLGGVGLGGAGTGTGAPWEASSVAGLFPLCACFASAASAAESTAAQSGDLSGEKAFFGAVGVVWNEDRVCAIGQGVSPLSGDTPQGKLLARRAAVTDLQRNLLEFVKGVRIEATTTLENFMAKDVVRSSVEGVIAQVEIYDSDWRDGIYTVYGGVRMGSLRRAAVSQIPEVQRRPLPAYEGKGFRELVLDARSLAFRPSLVVRVRSEGGRRVYGPEFIDRTAFLEKGMAAYVAKEEEESSRFGVPRRDGPLSEAGAGARCDVARVLLGFSLPAWADEAVLVVKGVGLAADGALVISDDMADLIEKNSYDFRIPGNVTIITKTAAIRGILLDLGTEEAVAAQAPFRWRRASEGDS